MQLQLSLEIIFGMSIVLLFSLTSLIMLSKFNHDANEQNKGLNLLVCSAQTTLQQLANSCSNCILYAKWVEKCQQ